MGLLGSRGGYLGTPDEEVVRRAAPAQAKGIAIIGQSNAVGQGRPVDLVLDTNSFYGDAFPAVRYMCHTGNDANPPLQVEYAEGDLGPRLATNGISSYGIELSMGRTLYTTQSGSWAFTKFAHGSTSLVGEWGPGSAYPTLAPSGKNLFTQMLDRVEQSMVDMSAVLTAIIWIQGENDALGLSSANAYAANLTNFVTAVHVRFPGTPFFYGRLNAAANYAYVTELRASQAADSGLPTYHMVDQDSVGLGGDSVHYASAALLTLGDIYAVEIASYLGLTIAPQARFTFHVGSLQVTFTDITRFVASAAVSWSWNFGDSSTSTTQNPVHTYASPGTYTVSLIATNAAGRTSTVYSQSVVAVSGIAGVSRDALSGKYVPETPAEWRTFLDSSAGGFAVFTTKSTPLGIWLCQEASANLADSSGNGLTLTAANAPAYQQTVTGMTRKGVVCADGTAKTFSSTSSSLPDISTTSALVLAIVQTPASAPAANRNIVAIGVAANRSYLGIDTTGKLRATSVSSVALSSASVCDGGLHVVADRINRGTLAAAGFLDAVTVTPTASSGMTGKRLEIGSQSGALLASNTIYACLYLFSGQDWSDTEVANLITKING